MNLATQPLSLGSRGTVVLNTSTVAGVNGQAGSITIASNAAYSARVAPPAAGLGPSPA